MYSVLAILFLIGVFLIVAGFLGRVGTDGISDVSENVAAAVALLVTYAFLILSLSSFSELATFFEGICGGIPYLREITDYGSLQNVIKNDPLSAAIAFVDTVILSATIETIMMIPLSQKNDNSKFMVNLFTGIVVAIASLLVLNYVIKETSVYQWIVSIVGSIIALLSIGTIPIIIISLFKKNITAGIGLIGIIMLFSKSKIAGVLRASFFKAIIYVCGIWLLEKYFGSIASGLSQISTILVAFGPAFVMIIGLVIILKSAKL